MIKSLKGKTQVHVLTITHFSGSYSFCNSQGLGMTKLRCPFSAGNPVIVLWLSSGIKRAWQRHQVVPRLTIE